MLALASLGFLAKAQARIDSFQWRDVAVAIDYPVKFGERKDIPVNLVLYALPNGNTIAWTMGKRVEEGDDWHFDIQHIRAQTGFVRAQTPDNIWVVAYLQAQGKSWPAWKTNHQDYRLLVQLLVDTLRQLMQSEKVDVYLNGHSGGGRFIFSYLDGVDSIPPFIRRISFLDSNYGYEPSYYNQLKQWLLSTKGTVLNVFAYNDSVALLNGKPFVSATGGTWHRSRMMLNDFASEFNFAKVPDDSVLIFRSSYPAVQFFLKENPDRKIFHTVQVERNGFIHSLLSATRAESKQYQYYRQRAYDTFIQ
jgi:hypothetical protein